MLAGGGDFPLEGGSGPKMQIVRAWTLAFKEADQLDSTGPRRNSGVLGKVLQQSDLPTQGDVLGDPR